MIEDVENGLIGICIMKDLTRWGRDHVQVGIAMDGNVKHKLKKCERFFSTAVKQADGGVPSACFTLLRSLYPIYGREGTI
jgi:hypothetical protein